MSKPRLAVLFALVLAVPIAASGQTPAQRREKLANLIPRHEGLGALAPANLNKKRPAAPFNMTGTWFVDLSDGFSHFRFGPPYPKFIGQAKKDFEKGQMMAKQHKPYRDAIGQCYPAGLPMVMTRVWPIAIVQLPTVIYMISNFEDSFRQIFLDGRKFSDPNTVVYTYNGESIGHWEGDTLVSDTRYVQTFNHFIDNGIPISDDFRVQERMKLLEDGEVLQIQYIMTDPNNWVGKWTSTKRWLRVDHTDINEVECLPDLDDNLPGTQAGKAGLQK